MELLEVNWIRSIARGVVIWLRTARAGLWMLWDILRSTGKVNDERLREVHLDERDISGKIIIITGCNSGIGKQTARELAGRGAKVIMACRDQTRAQDARRDILTFLPTAQLDLCVTCHHYGLPCNANPQTEFMQVDMSDMESIRSFVRDFKSRYSHLDVLVNNAGIFSLDMTTTKDGFESHMGTNYLGAFLLTVLLLDSLLKADDARIVFLSSSAMTMEVLDLDNLMMKDQPLGIATPYANSKLCLAMFSKQLAKLLLGTNVTTYAVCTGFVRTNLIRETLPLHFMALRILIEKIFCFPVEEGVSTVVHCVLSKPLSEKSGRFYRFLAEWKPAQAVVERHGGLKLWELSENLVGLKGFAFNFQNDLKRLVSTYK